MDTIERLKKFKRVAHEIGFMFLSENEYKENFVSDMYFMLRRFFENEIEILKHYENKKYVEAIEESFIDYLNHAPEYLRDIDKVESFYCNFYYIDSLLPLSEWEMLTRLIRRCKPVKE